MTHSIIWIISFFVCYFSAVGFKIGFSQTSRFAGTEIRYYGTACLSIQRGESVILTDPYVSNISALKAALGKIQTDKEYVDQYLNPGALRKVKMVVAGHSQYDHLLDLPYLTKYLPLSTKILLNYAGYQTLSYYQLENEFVVVDDLAGNSETPGFWNYSTDSTVRAMAFSSQLQPKFDNFLSNLNQQREYSSELKLEPVLSSEWPAGNVYSYIIDFFEQGEIDYRLVFMSSGADQPNGMFPRKLLVDHPVDDLIISGSANLNFENYPKPLIDLCDPDRIFLVHWERSGKKKESQMKAINQEQLDSLKLNLQKTYGDSLEVIVPMPLRYY